MKDCYPYDLPPMIDCNDIKKQKHLFDDAHKAIEAAKKLNAKTNEILHSIKNMGLENGVWYDPHAIKTEYAQYSNLSQYSVTTIRKHEKCGDPIFLKIHTAYGDTINNGVKEQIETAAVYECAQIITPVYGGADNYVKNMIVNGEFYPTSVDADYTLAFDNIGRMWILENEEIDNTKLKNMHIMQAFGCADPFVLSGEYVSGTAGADDSIPRVVIGQDDKFNKYILTTYDGLTLEDCAKILIDLGVTVAVPLSSNENAIVLREGTPVIDASAVNIDTEQVAYLYISKKDFFRNRFQFDICRAMIESALTVTKLNGYSEALAELEAKHDQDIADVRGEVGELETELKQLITEETERAQAAEQALQEAIDALNDEMNNKFDEIDETFETINTKLDELEAKDEEQAEQISALQTKLDGHISDYDAFKSEYDDKIAEIESKLELHDTQINTLQNQVSNLTELYTDVQGQLTTMNDAIVSILSTVNNIETTMNGLKDLYAQLVDIPSQFEEVKKQVSDLAERVEAAESSVGGYDDRISSLESDVTQAKSDISTAQSNITAIQGNISTIQTDVSGVKESISTIESSLGDKADQSSVTELEERVGDVETALDNKASTSSVTALENRVTTAEGDIDSLESRMDAVEGSVGDKADESDLTSLTGRVDTLETQITTKADQSSLDTTNETVSGLQESVESIESELESGWDILEDLKNAQEKMYLCKTDEITVGDEGTRLIIPLPYKLEYKEGFGEYIGIKYSLGSTNVRINTENAAYPKAVGIGGTATAHVLNISNDLLRISNYQNFPCYNTDPATAMVSPVAAVQFNASTNALTIKFFNMPSDATIENSATVAVSVSEPFPTNLEGTYDGEWTPNE